MDLLDDRFGQFELEAVLVGRVVEDRDRHCPHAGVVRAVERVAVGRVGGTPQSEHAAHAKAAAVTSDRLVRGITGRSRCSASRSAAGSLPALDRDPPGRALDDDRARSVVGSAPHPAPTSRGPRGCLGRFERRWRVSENQTLERQACGGEFARRQVVLGSNELLGTQ